MAPTYALVFVILLTKTLALTNPNGSNYFIGEFDIVTSKIGVAYAPGYCSRLGLLLPYAMFVCSADHKSITRYTYTSQDAECSGTQQSAAPQTFTHTADTVPGSLHDFNCAGKDNVLGYKTYLTDCDGYAGTAWLALDVCYFYKNKTEVVGNTEYHTDLPTDEYYYITGLNTCEGCTVHMDTYVPWRDQSTYTEGTDAVCPVTEPLTSLVGTPGCDLFFVEAGFEMYADAVACIHDGVDQFTVENGTCTYVRPISTTDSGSSEDVGSHVYDFSVALLLCSMMLSCANY